MLRNAILHQNAHFDWFGAPAAPPGPGEP